MPAAVLVAVLVEETRRVLDFEVTAPGRAVQG
jgi:hypothetical protein